MTFVMKNAKRGAAKNWINGKKIRKGIIGRGRAQKRRKNPYPEAADNLLTDHGTEGVVIRAPGAIPAQYVDDPPVRGDIAPHPPETLREGPHQHVHVRGVHAGVLAAPPSGVSHGPDGVCLVEVHVRAVPLARRDHLPEVAIPPLHRVYPLHDDQYAIPRPPRARLAVHYRLAKYILEVGCVVVTEGPYGRSRRPRAVDDARVIQLVADDEISRSREGRYHGGVRVEPHVQSHGVLLPHERRYDALHLPMQDRRAVLEAGRADGRRQAHEAPEDVPAAGDVPVVREAEVIVRP